MSWASPFIGGLLRYREDQHTKNRCINGGITIHPAIYLHAEGNMGFND